MVRVFMPGRSAKSWADEVISAEYESAGKVVEKVLKRCRCTCASVDPQQSGDQELDSDSL
jgi:hypothetical protein